jgi:hypothetical protein
MYVNFFETQLNEECHLAIFRCLEKSQENLAALESAIKNYSNGKIVEQYPLKDIYERVVVRKIDKMPFNLYNGQTIPNNLKDEDYAVMLRQFGINNVEFVDAPNFAWNEETKKIDKFSQIVKTVATYNLQDKTLIEFLMEHKDKLVLIMLQHGQIVRDNKIRGLIL